MDIGPSPEFREACRRVLGDDSPATIIGLLRSGDREKIEKVELVHADIVRAQKEGLPIKPFQKPYVIKSKPVVE